MTERIQLLVYYQTHRIPATTVFVVCWLLSDLRIPQIQLASAFPAAYDPEQLLVTAAAAEKTHRHAAQILPSEKGQSFWNVAKENLARMVASKEVSVEYVKFDR